MLVERPLYAYEVRKILKSRFGFNVATITIYMVLYKMEKEGLIKKSTKKKSARRQYYEITLLGLKTLKDGLSFLEKTLENLSLPEPSVCIKNPLNNRNQG
ncbi:helix-turn-helix transcriptional regulator [Candidatus Bathyarchaeota archaeon]|nr:helix-turn-helix transcriptional regulator [Candidatus Bathyarchaeota archaeon]MBS7618708.1 helix-turn-helix transcriptional regulator [Candidatus Bathyarchaeota archaeon]